jgi:hypothetical protein
LFLFNYLYFNRLLLIASISIVSFLISSISIVSFHFNFGSIVFFSIYIRLNCFFFILTNSIATKSNSIISIASFHYLLSITFISIDSKSIDSCFSWREGEDRLCLIGFSQNLPQQFPINNLLAKANSFLYNHKNGLKPNPIDYENSIY